MKLTAPRLIAALLMAALGWYVSDLIRPLMPESTIFGWFNHVNAWLGLFVGWGFLARRSGQGLLVAMSDGITAAFCLAAVGLFVQSVNEVLRLSTRRMYSNPLNALEDLFRIAADYAAVLLYPTVSLSLVIGAVVIAVLVEIASGFWR